MWNAEWAHDNLMRYFYMIEYHYCALQATYTTANSHGPIQSGNYAIDGESFRLIWAFGGIKLHDPPNIH